MENFHIDFRINVLYKQFILFFLEKTVTTVIKIIIIIIEYF